LIPSLTSAPSDLLDDHVDLIAVFHAQILGSLSFVQSFAIEEKPDIGDVELREGVITLCRWQ
jgi:hypothetical protein